VIVGCRVTFRPACIIPTANKIELLFIYSRAKIKRAKGIHHINWEGCSVNSVISFVYGRIPVKKQTKFADRDKGEKGVVELMDFIIARCRDRGVRKLERYSNTKLENALHLYRKYGFSEIPLPAHCVYDRTNVRMQLVL